MINTVLNIDDICQDCPYFSIETNHTTNYDGMHMIYMIYISCGRRDICNYLKKHIEKEANKDD